MRLLADSHILVWWLAGERRLTLDRRRLLTDPRNEIWFSSASIWEIEQKRAAGKLDLGRLSILAELAQERFQELPLRAVHARDAAHLPLIHRDPVDRFLVAQALAEKLMLLTDDETIRRYPVPTV